MPQLTNRRIVLAARPSGYPSPSDFRLEQNEAPRPEEGQVLVRVLWMSLDPYMRGRMRDAQSYAPSVQVIALRVELLHAVVSPVGHVHIARTV